jgi:hypothetical protein
MSFNLGPYGKAVNAVLVAGFGTAVQVLSDGEFDLKDGLSILINVLVVGAGVFFTRNTTKSRFAKLGVGAIATLAGLFLAALQDGTDTSTLWWITAVVTVANAIAISQTSNSVGSDGLEAPPPHV